MAIEQDQAQGGGASMNVIGRVGGILLRPATEWQTIAHEDGELSYVLNSYIAILAAIPALSGLIGFSAIGAGVPNVGTVRVPVFSGLLGVVFGYAFAFVAVYLLAVIINLLAGRYGATKSFAAALKLAVYSTTPVWVAGLFLLLPGLRFLTVLGLYGCYLLWLGLPVLMKSPPEQSTRYAAMVIAAALFIRFLIGWGEAVLFSLPATI
jgi:Yip1 domain